MIFHCAHQRSNVLIETYLLFVDFVIKSSLFYRRWISKFRIPSKNTVELNGILFAYTYCSCDSVQNTIKAIQKFAAICIRYFKWIQRKQIICVKNVGVLFVIGRRVHVFVIRYTAGCQLRYQFKCICSNIWWHFKAQYHFPVSLIVAWMYSMFWVIGSLDASCYCRNAQIKSGKIQGEGGIHRKPNE